MTEFSDVIKKGLTYLAHEQLSGGGFSSLALPTKYAKQGTHTYYTTFFPSLILSALSSIDDPNATTIVDKLVNFLLEQKGDTWSYNYWDRQSPEFTSRAYPDDLDDTFCALAALQINNPKLIDGKVLASAAKLLIATETKEGGPYRTWLTTSTKAVWRDVDVAVNANIAYFLSLQEVELPALVAYIEQAIRSNELTSPYYPNSYPLIYFIARWYRGKYKNMLINKLAVRKNGKAWGHPQRTALVVTSLLRLGYDVDLLQPAVEHLIHLQRPDGGWEAEAFSIDEVVEKKVFYGSSRAAATAFCLEAIQLFAKAVHAKKQQHNVQKSNPFYAAVSAQVTKTITAIEHTELRSGVLQIYNQILAQDEDRQIIMLPQLVAQATNVKPSSDVVLQLATASMWGWMAYTTYDDFLDNEGDIRLLPAANVCLRTLTETLLAILPESDGFHAEVGRIMNRLDAANAWEMEYCRGSIREGVLRISEIPDYGDYWQLADRSLGHTISGLGVLYAAGKPEKAPVMQAMRDYFFHYLIARQLNDDAHDWYDDLLMGHVNAVAAQLLQQQYTEIPDDGLHIDLTHQKASMQQLMWGKVIDGVCRQIESHLAMARQAILKPSLQLNTVLLESLLTPIESAAKTALQKRNEAQDFIANL